jgi:hypothetical protein
VGALLLLLLLQWLLLQRRIWYIIYVYVSCCVGVCQPQKGIALLLLVLVVMQPVFYKSCFT